MVKCPTVVGFGEQEPTSWASGLLSLLKEVVWGLWKVGDAFKRSAQSGVAHSLG